MKVLERYEITRDVPGNCYMIWDNVNEDLVRVQHPIRDTPYSWYYLKDIKDVVRVMNNNWRVINN
jgi:hypothetical protein